MRDTLIMLIQQMKLGYDLGKVSEEVSKSRQGWEVSGEIRR